jgi:preprotein translocase subunit SecG
MKKNNSDMLYSILPRFLLAIVAGWNLLCAIQFIIQPGMYLSAFDLSRESGRATVQSIGILFIMWNVPYLLAILQPFRWKILVLCALLMQAIGCIGEIWIRSQLQESPAFRDSLTRFTIFDVTGFFLLLLTIYLVNRDRRHTHVASTD